MSWILYMNLLKQLGHTDCRAGLYGCGIYPSFLTTSNLRFLEKKEAKIQGRHQGPSAHCGRPSPMSAIARAPSPVKRGRSRSYRTTLRPLGLTAGVTRDLISNGAGLAGMSCLRRLVPKHGISACRPMLCNTSPLVIIVGGP